MNRDMTPEEVDAYEEGFSNGRMTGGLEGYEEGMDAGVRTGSPAGLSMASSVSSRKSTVNRRGTSGSSGAGRSSRSSRSRSRSQSGFSDGHARHGDDDLRAGRLAGVDAYFSLAHARQLSGIFSQALARRWVNDLYMAKLPIKPETSSGGRPQFSVEKA